MRYVRCITMLLILLIGGRTTAETLEYRRFLMGTTARIEVRAETAEMCEKAIQAGFQEMTDVDRLMSTYKPDSQISQLNKAAGSQWLEVDSRVYDVLHRARTYGELSEGAFDITVLGLMRLWGFRGGPPRIPKDEEIARHLESVDYRRVHLHPDGQRARLEPGVEVDLGGIAKGYALDRAVVALRKNGAHGAVVDLGGNMLSFGQGPGSTVGIENPLKLDDLLGTIRLRDASIASSGGYERFVTIEGRRYGHVLDPRLGRPVDGMLIATVVTPTGVDADALSTALFVLGPDEGIALLERIEDAEGLIVWRGEGPSTHARATSGLSFQKEGSASVEFLQPLSR